MKPNEKVVLIDKIHYDHLCHMISLCISELGIVQLYYLLNPLVMSKYFILVLKTGVLLHNILEKTLAWGRKMIHATLDNCEITTTELNYSI